MLNRVKLIAEPWDLGTYQVGEFPGRLVGVERTFQGHRATVRQGRWRADPRPGLATDGSADLYADDGRSAYNSINFITCHDGFTLRDLVSYNQKHNEANLGEQRDGTNDNNSWNCGVEGETDDPEVNRLRRQIVKNYVCALLFSSGTPMILGGDEFMRTQRGNNNAYCQDNEISWFNWDDVKKNEEVLEFFKKTIAFEQKHTILQNRKFSFGSDLDSGRVPEITWFGKDLSGPSWDDSEQRTLCYRLDGREDGSDAKEDHLFFILNADPNLQFVRLPPLNGGKTWYRVMDTSLKGGEDFLEEGKEIRLDPPDHYLANPRSTVLLVGK